MSGVYFIKNISKSTEDIMYIKIGCSKDINKRFSQIKSSYRFNGSNDELELMLTIPCIQYKKCEKHLHILFNAYRKIGEYFALSEEKLNSKLFMLNLADYK